MIKARHHWFFTPFFNWYVRSILKRDFYKIEVIGQWKPVAESAIIIGNHFSWWDGFWALWLNNQFLHKRLHVMMLEDQLKPRRFLSKAGAYSIKPGSRSVVESLKYSVELLNDPQNAIVIYPQGKIFSMHKTSFEFEKGIERIVKQSEPGQLLLYAAFVDYFSNRKPTLFFYLHEIDSLQYTKQQLENLYNKFYQHSLTQQLDNTK